MSELLCERFLYAGLAMAAMDASCSHHVEQKRDVEVVRAIDKLVDEHSPALWDASYASLQFTIVHSGEMCLQSPIDNLELALEHPTMPKYAHVCSCI